MAIGAGTPPRATATGGGITLGGVTYGPKTMPAADEARATALTERAR